MTTKTQETTHCLNSKLNFSWIDKEKMIRKAIDELTRANEKNEKCF